MKTIFVLEEYYYRGRVHYPQKTIHRWVVGHYSSLKLAQRAMAQELDYITDPNKILCFSITEIKLNMNTKVSVRSYDGNGEFNAESLCSEREPFEGREESLARFKKGDIIQVICGYTAEIGIVSNTPPTPERVKQIYDHARERHPELEDSNLKFMDQGDDCYLILHCGGTEEDNYNHTHAQAWIVFPAPRHLPTKIVEELRTLLRTS